MAIQVAALSTLLMAMGVIGIDVGRMVVLRAQMQNAADAAALAAAAELDGFTGARTRADAVARLSAQNVSNLPTDVSAFTVQSVSFFADYGTGLAATSDADALAVRVELAPKTLNLMLMPILDLLTEGTESRFTDITARASAQNAPLMCDVTPLMICDPAEGKSGAAYDAADLSNPANIGKQLVIKGSSDAPGNFGLLCPEDGSNCGAAAVGDMLAQPNPTGCVNIFGSVETATGQKEGPISDGINSRFNIGNKSEIWQAPNIVSYDRDSLFLASADQDPTQFGAGDWNAAGYWATKHGGAVLPVPLIGATRYQAYLYELGATYAVNGRRTLYPVPAILPAGYTIVTPPGTDMPAGGTPDPANPIIPDPRRRLVKAVILACNALGVNGHGIHPSSGRYAEFFITEPVSNATTSKRVLGELVGVIQADWSAHYHANVRLLD